MQRMGTRLFGYNKGFTIVELLIVIVVIAILGAITIVAYNGITTRANTSADAAALSQVNQKIAAYVVDYSTPPPDLATIGVNDGNTAYQYSVNTGVTPATWGVTATTGFISYYISSTSQTPTAGGYAGHGVGGTSAITNMSTNPSFETDMVGWTNLSRVTAARDSTWSASGNYSALITPTDSSNPDAYISMGGDIGAVRLGMQPGHTYTASVTVRLTAAETGTLGSNARRLMSFTKIGSGAYVTTLSTAAPNAAGTTRISTTFTVPIGATEAFVRFNIGDLIGGGTAQLDAFMLTDGSTLYNYADGNSPNWVWNGTPINDVTSTGPQL